MSEFAAELKDVHLTLPSKAGSVDILRGIDLEVKQGEAIGMVGPSGSGKTTLLMVLAGLEQASSGQVRIAGFDLGGQNEDSLATFRRDHVGIIFQAFHLIPTMTALENVAIPLEFKGEQNAYAMAEERLNRVELGHRLHHYPGQLSGGEQQRVALARALASGASLILADEPTGNLDQGTGNRIIELMFKTQRETGATLVLVTHDPSLAARCDRIAHIADGKISSIEVPAAQELEPA